MSENTTVMTQASEITAEGLAEAIQYEESRLARQVAKAEKEQAGKVARMQALAEGRIDDKLNPKGNHNPQVLAETVRAVPKGELVGDLVSKGWVVTICCATCGEERTVNVQDAFQVRYCSASCKPKKSATKVGSKVARRLASEYTLEQLQAMLAEREAAA